LFCLGSRPNYGKTGKNADGIEKSFMSRMFQKWYGPVLMHPVMRVVVMVWFALYLGLAGWACTQVVPFAILWILNMFHMLNLANFRTCLHVIKAF